jgi:hypothetical protein
VYEGYNAAIGNQADVTNFGISNLTAIGYNAKVDMSNKVKHGQQ